MHSPRLENFDVVYRILRYLKETHRRGQLFKKYEQLQIKVYTNANWAENINDRRSTCNYCTFVRGNLVTWWSKKQNVVARSSAKVEFRLIVHGICEMLQIKRLLEELKIFYPSFMNVYPDNGNDLNCSQFGPSWQNKHVEVDKYFIKEKDDNGLIYMLYIWTTE